MTTSLELTSTDPFTTRYWINVPCAMQCPAFTGLHGIHVPVNGVMAMFNAARVGDAIGHGGAIATGSPDVTINEVPAAFVTSAAGCALHGGTAVVSGSCSVFINGFPATFVTGMTACGAPIVTGSVDVLIGE